MYLKKMFLLVIITSFITVVYGFDTELQFREPSFDLRDHSFVGDLVGYAVGTPYWDQDTNARNGTVIKTEDGGESWEKLVVPVVDAFNGVKFVSEDQGWVVGQRGTVLYTEDGGDSWQILAQEIDHELRDVFFLNSEVGWIAGAQSATPGSRLGEGQRVGIIYRTDDGGQNWERKSIPRDFSVVNRLFFLDSQTGFAAGGDTTGENGSGIVFKTENGGDDWESVLTSGYGNLFSSVFFLNDELGWATSLNGSQATYQGSTAFKTTDGAESWEELDLDYNLRDIQFIDSNRGYTVGSRFGSPPLLGTVDGGQTWELISMNYHRGEGLWAVHVTENRMVAVGDRDFSCISANPWHGVGDASIDVEIEQIQINPQYRMFGVYFINDLVGWATGIKLYVDHGTQVIFHTTDAGETWELQYESNETCLEPLRGMQRVNDIVFVDENRGWAAGFAESDLCNGFNNSVLYTEDGGETWEPKIDQTGHRILSIAALGDIVWLLPENREHQNIRILKSTDNGVTWELFETPISEPLQQVGEIFFLDDLNGWIAGGSNGLLLSTSDGGETWQRSADETITGAVNAVHFSSLTEGWVGGENLYYTADGGETWQLSDLEFGSDQINSIKFVSENVGWIAGDWGVIMHTQDGGESWSIERGTRANYLRIESMHLVNDSLGWAVGDAGTIVRINGPAVPLSITNRVVPRTSGGPHITKQGNQFTYHFRADGVSTVQIDILDLRGRTVYSSTPKRFRAGAQVIRMDARGLSNGMYMVRVKKDRDISVVQPLLIGR
ncbi:YCF48-related protein [Chitinispirillales bacterium ANBcel5]|uniref:YCF48-related protein n=1 Tax=Cellulosispirillum alkaliphilum TaxID=3039283 RepID=UPI002A5620B9|nr:YCF48-related protein [Chitinispirillales bacterium ANBcel5]